MKLLLLNTAQGLKPCYDEDYDEKKKLKIGVTYSAEIRQPRNLGFHRKFFSLIKLAHENLPEGIYEPHPSMDTYRNIVTIKAGFYKSYKSVKGIYLEPESISFGNMNQERFEEVYNRVLDVILLDIGGTSEELEREILNYI